VSRGSNRKGGPVTGGPPDEDELFAAEMQDVQPLDKGREQNLRQAREDVSIAEQHRRDAALGIKVERVDENSLSLGEVPSKEPLETLEWKKVGVQHGVFNKLRKGGYKIEAQLDLHGKTVKEAREIVFAFIKQASARNWRSLLIAHGKGELSKTPARLKSYLAAWLEQHEEVIAFCSAERRKGGVGAVYVLVRKSLESKELNREEHGQKSDNSLP
jgi:DNA-nicking Smr family endonuclease